MSRCTHQFSLFQRCNTLGRPSKKLTGAQSNLDEYHYRAVAHDEIDLSKTATVISRHQNEILILEKSLRILLGFATLQSQPFPRFTSTGSPRDNNRHNNILTIDGYILQFLPYPFTILRAPYGLAGGTLLGAILPPMEKPSPVSPGVLYVVGTPIGNLRDISLRALETLGAAGLVAAEDTRVTGRLLEYHGLSKRLISLHRYNEAATVKKIGSALAQGTSVALVTDAGTPGISDPGGLLVSRIRHLGYKVVPIPGPSAAICALSAAGIVVPHFLFYGFLPAARQARRRELKNLNSLPYGLVFYEAPHRILECVADMADMLSGRRELAIARELTKLFETIHVCSLGDALGWMQEDLNRQKGEFVLILTGLEKPSQAELSDQAQHALDKLLEVVPLTQAVRLVADITGESRSLLYARALSLRKDEIEKKNT